MTLYKEATLVRATFVRAISRKGEYIMKSNIGWLAFVLLMIGTLGLLMNEFAFAWGRPATLAFAAANIVGLLVLGFSCSGKK